MEIKSVKNGLGKGFSLTELLVVVFIITILLSVVGVGSLGKNGHNVSSSINILEGLVFQARSVALEKNTTTRLLINNDETDEERYLREVLVIYDNADAAAINPDWRLAGRPILLPRGIQLDPTVDVTPAKGDLGELTESGAITLGGGLQRASVKASHYLSFNRLGLCVEENPVNPAEPKTGATLCLEDKKNPNDRLALVVWRNGGTSIIRDIDRITP